MFGVWAAGLAWPSGCSVPVDGDYFAALNNHDDSHLTTVLMVDGVPVTHWRRLVLSHVRLRYVEPGHHYQGQNI